VRRGVCGFIIIIPGAGPLKKSEEEGLPITLHLQKKNSVGKKLR